MNADSRIDTVVSGKYRLGDVVGSGGMGKVHEATQIEGGEKVAIKLLHRWHEHDDHSVARFHREAELASAIGHKNICEVIDNGVAEDGTPYLVMPLLSGVSFGDMLKEGPVPLERIVDILCQTLAGLEAAHTEQIVHRDLKPDNIFVTTEDNGSDSVKILDFGVSKYFGDDFNEALTRTGTIPGTPAYMSPEQATGAKKLDARIDLYATGVVLYEALTGRRPFEGESYNEILFNIISKPFDPPRKFNPDIPQSIEKVILKAMERNPGRRFANAYQMSMALEAALDGQDLVEEFPTITQDYIKEEDIDSFGDTQLVMQQKNRSFFSGNRRLVFLASAGVVTMAAAIVVWLSGALEPTSSSDEFDENFSVESVDTKPVEVPKAPTDTSVWESVEPIDTATVEELASNPEVPPPTKNSRRGSKKKTESQKDVKSEGSEDEKDPKESEKDMVDGRFGTTFVGEYGE